MAVALIVAAGLGERLGAGRPKALVELAGRPLLHWSVDVLSQVSAIERIVVALPAAVQAPQGTVGVLGGAVRSESVRAALDAAGPGDPVLVHDAARPLLTAELVRETLAAVEHDGVDAAIAATPVTDTVKRVSSSFQVGSSEKRIDGSDVPQRFLPVVGETLDRAGLWAVQTPQVFRRAALQRALEVSDDVLAQATDDAWLVERAGGRVVIVPSPPENLKVTTALDLALAELLVARGKTRL
ncbi:MAG: 2-C-methyl-D-erythritol 4-phosphate cytidylyltransferase [Solirubrobacteraceae bacterium]